MGGTLTIAGRAGAPWEGYWITPHLRSSLYTCNNIVIARQLMWRVPLEQRQWRRQTTSLQILSHLLNYLRKLADDVITEEERFPKEHYYISHLPYREQTGFLAVQYVINTSSFVVNCERSEFRLNVPFDPLISSATG